MSFFKVFLLVFISIFFTACSSKTNISINEQIRSFQVDKNIKISPIQKTVDSPVAINVGVGGYSNHVGIRVGKTVIPKFKNTDALTLEKAIKDYKIDFEKLVYSEFLKSIKEDTYYKNKLVPFGANHTMKLTILDYDIDDSLVSSTSTTKISLEVKIIDKLGKIVYINKATASHDFVESEKIYKYKNLLIKILKLTVKDASSKLLLNMKKD